MNIKDVKLRKGMSREEVNELIGEWLILEDEVYLERDYKHNWRCECGNLFERRWHDIRHNNNSDCGCIQYSKIEERYKHEVEKTGEYEYLRSFRKGDKLPNDRIVGDSPYIQLKHKYCGNVYEVTANGFINERNRCGKCCGSYENSFAYHIEVELGESLEKYWDFEKNTVNPYHISRGSHKKVWIKCQEKDYHGSYEISCDNFTKGVRCPYCSRTSGKVHPLDSFGYKYKNLAKMIFTDERNKIIAESTYNISVGSNKKFYVKCTDCGSYSDKKYSINKLTSRGYSCKICSDGLSVPEKFLSNVLSQCGIYFITQLNKTTSNWCEKYRYDFYIPSLNMIIETHGEQHYKDTNRRSARTLKEEQENDRLKRELALNNGVDKYVEIDCRKSELGWVKDNILKSLSMLNLESVQWDKAWVDSQDSLCVKTWRLWNGGIHDVKYISKVLNLHPSTTWRYLKIGSECNKCSYSIEESVKSSISKRSGHNHYNAKNVICLTTGKIFRTALEAAVYYKTHNGNILKCCNGEYSFSGKVNNTPLVWRYVIYKHNYVYRIKRQVK